ncbi:MAG: hypothetical protein ACYCOU_25005 [Sulfobacillus sp.]
MNADKGEQQAQDATAVLLLKAAVLYRLALCTLRIGPDQQFPTLGLSAMHTALGAENMDGVDGADRKCWLIGLCCAAHPAHISRTRRRRSLRTRGPGTAALRAAL